MKNTIITFLIGLVTIAIIFLAFTVDFLTLISIIIGLVVIVAFGMLILGQIYAVGIFIKGVFDIFMKKE